MAKQSAESLREALARAIDKDRPRDIIAALEGLQKLEPDEPRWPHRLGDVYRRLGNVMQAADAYERAMHAFAQHGYMARAVAVAKLAIALDASRADILRQIQQEPTRILRAGHCKPWELTSCPSPPDVDSAKAS